MVCCPSPWAAGLFCWLIFDKPCGCYLTFSFAVRNGKIGDNNKESRGPTVRPNLGFYVQTINDLVKETEAIGEKMNPNYEEIRKAIDEKKEAEVTPERLAEITRIFKEGTDKYRLMLEKISKLRPPANVMGNHKKFERAYMKYVAGCDEMILSLDNKIDQEAFDAAEAKQDEATDEISFAIQRMTALLLKK